MGCFDCNGGISKLPIRYGDKCVLFIGVTPKNVELNDTMSFGAGFKFTPITLPIFGDYDDYGRIENIRRNKNIDLIERLSETTIEDLINAIDNIMANRCTFSDKNETICEKFLTNVLHEQKERYEIAYMLEHEFIYDSIVNMEVNISYDFKQSIKTVKKLPYTLEDYIDKKKTIKLLSYIDFETELLKIRTKSGYGETITNVNPNFGVGFFRTTYMYDSYVLLSAYKDDNVSTLLNELSEEYEKFLVFFEKLNYLDWNLSIHNYGGQNGKRNLKAMRYVFENILKFINDINDDEQ